MASNLEKFGAIILSSAYSPIASMIGTTNQVCIVIVPGFLVMLLRVSYSSSEKEQKQQKD